MNTFLLDYIGARELGKPKILNWKEHLYSSLYAAVKPTQVTETTPSEGLDWGAIFGFGFSPDGSLLAAACENKCMLMYDPHNARLLNRRFKTHTDCVNCIRFLDDRMFATCSDDNTVRLWDTRFLNHEIKIMKGHTSWVKSIEYCSSEGKLLTSGFDGNIFSWNINNYSETEKGELLLNANGIMRMKVTPDEKKMIIATIGGFLLLIHDLDLVTLREDLKGFKPNFYYAMDLFNKFSYNTSQSNPVFIRERNRVEIISDFPGDDTAESISTIQVHPQGWCIASRNTTSDEKSEWTSIHDIQTLDNQTDSASSDEETSGPSSSVNRHASERWYLNPRPIFDLWRMENVELNERSSDEELSEDSRDYADQNFPFNSPSPQTDSSSSEFLIPISQDQRNGSDSVNESNSYNTFRQTLGNSFINLLNDSLMYSNPTHISGSQDTHHSGPNVGSQANVASEIAGSSPQVPTASEEERPEVDGTAYRQHLLSNSRKAIATKYKKQRLLFYSEEPNVGRGFIKEQSFSSDGKVLASPFANSVRLLGFNHSCSEICDIVPKKPRQLCQVAMTVGHSSTILASTFSPVHCMFVAGARDGSICFCSPRF
ncbi:DDB1- and CUL4-associated factor 10 [Biomphalaria pfeifferi]|uniref:DDB1- and CUL4-associated factor 10 n=1 Tax=Biomphalaria pfeifferi TaxID=112525 RepID=A0AAD8BTX0_BIOPF|nr:DDB1- and CUL4-associated factor 10 [Biomphalaria pfeifferi]